MDDGARSPKLQLVKKEAVPCRIYDLCHKCWNIYFDPRFPCSDLLTGTPSILQRLFMGRTKGLKGDGAGMDIRVFPPKARDSRFERSMGDALRQQNEKLEMQEVREDK